MRPIVIVAALAAVSLAACGKKEAEPKSSVSITSDGYKVTSREGGAVVATGAAAQDAKAPAYAEPYPGSTITTAITAVRDSRGDGGTMVYKTNAGVDDVLKFYRKKAEDNGFKAEMDANMGAMHMFAAKQESTLQAFQVMVTPEGSETNVQVIWAVRPK